MSEGAGFFSRLSNLWKGFVSLWISDIEKGSDPGDRV